jgi:hypothetical protein
VTEVNQRCAHCEDIFAFHELEEHLQNEECFDVFYYCQTCCTFSPNYEAYNKHLNSCQLIIPGLKPPPCRFCKLQFQHKTDLVQHLYKVHISLLFEPKEKCKFECQLCLGLQNHRAKKCVFCGVVLFSETDLLKHLFEHHNENNEISPKVFSCGLCGEKFNSASLLFQHHASLTCYAKVKICKICAQIFPSSVDLSIHCQSQHNTTNPPKTSIFFCKNCTSTFESQFELEAHNISNHIKYFCAFCGVAFTRKARYDEHDSKFECKKQRLHQRKQSQDKDLAVYKGSWCRVCRKTLKKHEVHSHPWIRPNLKPTCEFCIKFSESSLANHILAHHVICDCKKLFANVQDLFAHKIQVFFREADK